MALLWGVQGGGKYSKLGLFSKATFRLEDGQDIDIEDKDFWIKVPLYTQKREQLFNLKAGASVLKPETLNALVTSLAVSRLVLPSCVSFPNNSLDLLPPPCVSCVVQVVGKDPEEQLRLMEEQQAEKEKAERLKGRTARNKYAHASSTESINLLQPSSPSQSSSLYA